MPTASARLHPSRGADIGRTSTGKGRRWAGGVEREATALSLPGTPSRGGRDCLRVMEPLEEIASLTWQLGEVADCLPVFVDAARAGGASWAEVGAAHGISRQAAQRRYSPGR